MAATCAEAAERLAGDGVSAAVIVVACITPSPEEDLAAVLGNVGLAVTVEAHHVAGGLGSLVAEVIAERNLDCRLIRCGASHVVYPGGSKTFLEQAHGLSAEAIASTVVAALAKAS
jgi:transketolase